METRGTKCFDIGIEPFDGGRIWERKIYIGTVKGRERTVVHCLVSGITMTIKFNYIKKKLEPRPRGVNGRKREKKTY